MKLLTNTSIKAALLVLLTVAATASVRAQDARIQTGQLDALAAKASETVDVNIDESLMQMTAKFLSSKDPDEAKVKALVNGLKGIYVKSFEFESEGQYSAADLESIRVQLRNSAWSKVVNINSKKDGSIEVYLMHVAGNINGLAVLAFEPKEITVVNIVGPVDLEKLSDLEGNFGVPVLGIDYPKAKRKN
jgi:hypothetical protein